MPSYAWEPEIDKVVFKGDRYRFAVVVPQSWTSDQTQTFLEGQGWDVKSIGVPPSDVAQVLTNLQQIGVPVQAIAWWVIATWTGTDGAKLPEHAQGSLYYATLDRQYEVQPGQPDPNTPVPPPTPEPASAWPAVAAFTIGFLGLGWYLHTKKPAPIMRRHGGLAYR